MNTLHTLWGWYQTIAPWLLLSLLPSLAVGMSYFPQLKGARAALLKAIDLLSVATFKNSPSTFKAPLVPSDPPQGSRLQLPDEDDQPPLRPPTIQTQIIPKQ